MNHDLAASIREGGGGGGGGGRAPVSVILLAENHYSSECHAKNRKLVTELLEKHKIPKETIVFVSEGDRINPCYLRLGIQPSNIIIEYEVSNKPMYHYFQLFMFSFIMFESTISGVRPLKEEDFKHNGKLFSKMLRKIPEDAGMLSYIKLIHLSLVSNEPEYRKELLHLCELLHDHAFNDEVPNEKAFLQRLAMSIIEHNGEFEYADSPGGPLEEIDKKREKAVLDKMNVRVQGDPTITTVVIIFGKAHYRNLQKLLLQSQIFKMDKSLSNITTESWETANNENEDKNQRKQRKRKTQRKTRKRKGRKINKF